MAAGRENQHDGWIHPPSQYLGACCFYQHFVLSDSYFPSFPSSLASSSTVAQAAVQPSIHPTALILLPPLVQSHPSSHPLSINLLFPRFLSHGLTIYSMFMHLM